MARYANDKFVKDWYSSQGGKKFIADRIFSEQCFERTLSQISKATVSSKDLSEKEIMLEKGISYAYLDIEGKGLESCEDKNKNHVFFIKGYDIGNRRRKIEGMTAYINNIDLSVIPDEVKSHHKFIEGYEKAKANDERNFNYKHR